MSDTDEGSVSDDQRHAPAEGMEEGGGAEPSRSTVRGLRGHLADTGVILRPRRFFVDLAGEIAAGSRARRPSVCAVKAALYGAAAGAVFLGRALLVDPAGAFSLLLFFTVVGLAAALIGGAVLLLIARLGKRRTSYAAALCVASACTVVMPIVAIAGYAGWRSRWLLPLFWVLSVSWGLWLSYLGLVHTLQVEVSIARRAVWTPGGVSLVWVVAWWLVPMGLARRAAVGMAPGNGRGGPHTVAFMDPAAMEELSKTYGEVVHWRRLAAFLPSSLGPYEAGGDASGDTRVSEGRNVSTAQRVYRSPAGSELKLSITDTSQAPDIRASVLLAQGMGGEENGLVRRSMIISGRRAFVGWNRGQGAGGLAVMVGKRYLLGVTLHRAQGVDSMIGLVRDLDLSGLEQLHAD